MQINQKGFGLVAGLLVLVIIGSVGFAGYYALSQNDSSETQTKETQQKYEPIQVSGELKLTGARSGIQIGLVDYIRNVKSSANTPSEGNEFVAVKLKYINSSEEATGLVALMPSAVINEDFDNRIFSEDISESEFNEWSYLSPLISLSYSVPANGSLEGYFIFELPINSEGVEIATSWVGEVLSTDEEGRTQFTNSTRSIGKIY